MADDSTLPSPGDVLAGKYQIERLIGRGGMGAVFAAQHMLLNQRVAVKLLVGELVSSEEATNRFMNEARAAAKIQGDHVARVLDIGQLPDGTPYMVLEYLDGTDLAGLLQQRGVLGVSEVADYALQALDALAQAHAAGIVHRDLKPANLFLARRHDGTSVVKVLDFGISKNLHPLGGTPQGMTQTRALLGSPEYMSPEQLRTPRGVDTRTDIWSLGVILYELLTGKMPFTGESLGELFMQIMESTPPPLRAHRADVPAALEAVVLRCMTRDPNARFANVKELADVLTVFASDQMRALMVARGSAPGLVSARQMVAATQAMTVSASTAHPSTAAPWASTGEGSRDTRGGAGRKAREGRRDRRRERSLRGRRVRGGPRDCEPNEGDRSAPRREPGVGDRFDRDSGSRLCARDRRSACGSVARRGERYTDEALVGGAAGERRVARVTRAGGPAGQRRGHDRTSPAPDAKSGGIRLSRSRSCSCSRSSCRSPVSCFARRRGKELQSELLFRQRRSQTLQAGMLLMKVSSKSARVTGLFFLAALPLAVGSASPAFAAPTPHECAAASEDASGLQKQEKLVAARDRFLACADAACPAEIREECAHRVAEVTAATPSVVFDVKDAAGNDVSSVRVTMDGALLVDHLGASAVTIDPGEHTFHFDGADPSQAVEKKFVIRDGEKNRHLAITLGGAPPLAIGAPVAAIAPAPNAAEQPASSWNGRKTIALVLGGAGVVALGVGAVFGGLAFPEWSSAKSECATSCGPGSQAQSDKSAATRSATISDVGLIGGAALIAGAAVEWFTAPSGAQVQVAPTAGAIGGGLMLRWTF